MLLSYWGAGERDSHVSTKSFKRKALRPQRRRVEAICQPNVLPKSNTASQAGSQDMLGVEAGA